MASPDKAEKESLLEAESYLMQGKCHLFNQNYVSAVNSLQKACRLFSQKFGDMASECGEVYFCYGKALIELARLENGTFEQIDTEHEQDSIINSMMANADDSVQDIETRLLQWSAFSHKDEKDVTQQDESKGDTLDDNELETSENMENTSSKEDTNSKDLQLCEGMDDVTKDEEPVEICNSGEEESDNSSTQRIPVNDIADQEEDVPTLQLAWEVLELSRIIFKRQAEKNQDMQLKVADVLSLLGEVSMESENYKNAIDDFQESLKIKLSCLKPDSRVLAETYFQLGLAYSFDNQFSSAIEYFMKTKASLEKCIDSLKVRVEKRKSSESTSDDAENDSRQEEKEDREIRELENLLPAIESKIAVTQMLIENNA